MLEKYRSGKILLPERRFTILISFIPSEEKGKHTKKISKKDSNWGQIVGGRKAYLINKKAFELGRKKGNKFRSEFPKYNFNTNMELSEELCEFIGAVIGDGFTNKYNSAYQTEITGDKNLDKEYYEKILSLICERRFNIKPIIKKLHNKITLTIYSKRLYELLVNRFSIPAGVKSYTVKIPQEILRSRDIFLKATLRGMFNTDGGVGFDRRKAYKKPYVRINYVSASKELINQIHNSLNSLSIAHTIHLNQNEHPAGVIQINGEKNVKNYLRKIGFSNPRHLSKVSHLV
jgi:hypothetical protein